MQIIQKIREKGAAIVIGVIALSLIGFILMDANLGLSRNAGGDREVIGEVNGRKISTEEYNAKVKLFEGYYGGRVSGPTANYVRQSAWDELVKQRFSEAEYEKLGITFSAKELSTIIYSAEDAPQILKQNFTDKTTNQYDVARVQQWWAEVKKEKGGEKVEIAETQVIEPARKEALERKYGGLLAASAYYPGWMKEEDAADAKKFATISYVAIPYSVVNDSTVKVSDEDIMNYMSKRKAAFEQDGGRKIAFVNFSTNPSAADSAGTFQAVNSLREAFIADSTPKAFLSKNNSTSQYVDMWIPKSKLNGAQKDTIATLPLNTVYGPFQEAGNFILAKKIAERQVPDTVKCRHILIATKDQQSGAVKLTDSAAKQKIDSVEAAVRAGGDFAALAKQYSDDAGSKDKGGEYTIPFFSNNPQQDPLTFASLAKEFGEAAFFGNAGDKKVIKTELGYHYIEVISQSSFEPAYKIAYMSRDITASEETVRKATADANNLAAAAKDVKSFDEYVAKNKLQKTESPAIIKENDFAVGEDLPDAKQVVSWAFKAKQGEVSEPIVLSDRIVVGLVTKVVPKGLPDVQSVRPQWEAKVRQSKKAEIIKAKLTASPTLETAAAAYPGTRSDTAGADSSLVFSSSIINGVGPEPKVIGAAFNEAYKSKPSEPIEGVNGVYVIKVLNYGEKAVDLPPSDKAKRMAGEMFYRWAEGLKKLADIEDERSKFN